VHLRLRAMGLPTQWTGVPVKRIKIRLRVERAGVWHSSTMRVLLYPGWG
jgi:hypothetical protein